jgi:SAM-dependent MidA family methyltransferase
VKNQTQSASPIIAAIRDHIRQHGATPFSWFMEQALYHPEFGYYTAPRVRVGRDGDYYTNVSVGPVYGQLLASQLLEMWNVLDRPDRFTIVEQGAENGQLASDILSALLDESPKASECIRYVIVEPLLRNQRQQRAILENNGSLLMRVTWCNDLTDLQPITGAFISNELIDAMPVRIVEYRDGGWVELFVGLAGDEFRFVPAKIVAPELSKVVSRIPLPPVAPYRTEVNLAAAKWVRTVSSKLERGFVLTVDYGYTRDEFYKPERTEGTLSCYSRHRRFYNPFDRPGEIDITAHVDFTSLAEDAEQAGLKLAGYTDQHHFMIGAAESRLLALEQSVAFSRLNSTHSKFLRSYQTLMHPGNMGIVFKYLLLTKGLECCPKLSGFKFAADPWASLESRARSLNQRSFGISHTHD